MIYFDNGATTLVKPESVLKEIVADFNKLGNPSRGSYTASEFSMDKVYGTRQKVAKLFNVSPMDVAFTYNITTSLNLVLKSLLTKEDHVITTLLEHNSVLRPLYQLEDQGMGLSFIDVDDHFNLKLEMLEELLQENTKAVVITHASNVIGNVTDLERVHEFTKKHGLILIIDGAQGAGAVKTDLSKFTNTIYCFTGHKCLYGPTGTGGIIKLGDFDFHPVFSGGSGFRSFERETPSVFPDVFEYGTINSGGIAALGAGIDYVMSKDTYKILSELKDYLYESMKTIKGIKIYGDFGKNHLPTLSFNIGDNPSGEVSRVLFEQLEVCSRPGSHCAPLVHKRAGTVDQGMVRFSLSTFNTKEEIDTVVEFLRSIVE